MLYFFSIFAAVMIQKLLTSLILSLTALLVQAVDIQSRKLDTDIGLPDNNVRNISQDAKGFIWIGTPNGLFRYDGYFFTTYKYSETGNTQYLNNNHVTASFKLSSGMMLFREQGNLWSLFDVKTNRFLPLKHESRTLSYKRGGEHGGDLWLGDSEKGCVRIKVEEKNNGERTLAYTFFNTHNKELRSDHLTVVRADSRGIVWICTDEDVYYVKGEHAVKTNTRKHVVALVSKNGADYMVTVKGEVFKIEGNKLRLQFAPRNEIVVTKAADIGGKRIVMTTIGAAMEYNISSRTLSKSIQIPAVGGNIINDNHENAVVLDELGHIWFTDRKTGEIIPLNVFSQQLFPLVPSKKYKVVTSEKNGLIWVSTNGCGMTVYDRWQHQAEHIGVSTGHLSTDWIQDICMDDDDNVWVADEFHGIRLLTVSQHRAIPVQGSTDYTGQVLLNKTAIDYHENMVNGMSWQTDSLLLIINSNGDVYQSDKQLHISEKPLIKGKGVRTVATDKNGTLWIGTRRNGLFIGNQHYRNEDGNSTSLSSDNIRYLFLDNKGRMWVVTEDSYIELAVPGKDGKYTFRHFLNEKIGAKIITQDHKGNIWVGASMGLYRFDPKEILKNGAAYQEILKENDMRNSDIDCLFEDFHHRLWVGTIGQGVLYTDLNAENMQFNSLTETNGLISNEVQSIAETADGTIWISSKKGMTCYHPERKSFRYVYHDDNPLHNYYAENGVVRLNDGRLVFGTNQGLITYDAILSNGRQKKSSLVFTDILVNGVSVGAMDGEGSLTVAPDNLGELELAYDRNSINIRFSCFNYRVANGTRYTYWLENYDKEWSELSPLNFAVYKQLPPGHYVLHVKAYNLNSSEIAERQLTIIIRHPWWQTWWAYLLYVVLLTSVGYVVWHQLRTVYLLRRRISIEKELTEYKLRFFTNISHEFRTPLTIIRVAMDHMRSVKDIPAELRQSLSNMGHSTDRMLRLINQLLEFRKMQAGKLQLSLEETDIIAFVRDIFQNFSDLAENKNINYSFTSNMKTYDMPLDRQHIDKVVYNLLSNAFKYTPSKGNIDVSVRIAEGQAIITVKDTGVGIPKEKQSELFQRFMQSSFSGESIGIGLHLTKALVEVHHGKIRFEENQPQGSLFIVELPTISYVYKPSDFMQQSELRPVVLKQIPVYQEMMGEPMNDRNILIVEDDADVINMLKQTLGAYFHVSIAMDGTTALDMLNTTEKPDLIISDVMMPVMNGYDLTRRIRSQVETQTIPIILLTALTNEEKRLKGTQVGADAFLTKPFDMRLLISTCRQLIEQRDLLRKQIVQDNVQTITPPEIIVEERDRRLLDAMNMWLESHLSDQMLSVDDMAEAMGYRRSVFFKKVKLLTGQTPAEYIKNLRMNRAAEMLRDETITVAEVCYKVGISDPHYFTKVFKQQFGLSPKKYQQGK